MRVSPRIRGWLTGPRADPSVRTRFFTEVEGRPLGHPLVRSAVKEIGKRGWAASLLAQQLPDGRWSTPRSTSGELYRPKFIATNWVAIVLADLGMTRADPRIGSTADLLLERWGSRRGDLSGRSGEVCVTGNAVRTLIRFGYLDHPAVQRSLDWIVRAQKPDGGWHCHGSNKGTLDAWEGLAALAEVPEGSRTPSIRRAIEQGAEFYLERKLVEQGKTPYAPWFRIHYPNHYFYDVLVGLRILTRLGFGTESRLAPALQWLRERQRPDGTWALDAAHPDADSTVAYPNDSEPVYSMMLEPLLEPSQWATVEALSVLARVDGS